MKLALNCLLFLFLLVSPISVAQNVSGIIKYTGTVNKVYVDSFLTDLRHKDIPMDVKQTVVEAYNNAMPEEFVLHFTAEESYYYHLPSLVTPDGIINIGSMANTNSIYTNNTQSSIIESDPYVGNIAHEALEWEITNKTKTIGGYKCFQATATEKLYSRRGFFYNRKVIAWFTPQIPLNYGPQYYKGLPGLILELDASKFTLRATELNLNPQEEIKIKRPSEKEKVISQKESHERVKRASEDSKKLR